jgi:hypothetical protein
MKDFKEHGVLLYLTPSLYLAFIKLQGDKGLGRSFAGLLAFNEGMHTLGYISDEQYEENRRKYSRKLFEAQPQKPLTLEQVEAKKQHDGMARAFSGVYSQWNLPHNDPLWRDKWVAKAKE